jgi:hypothetical protein
MVRLAHPVLKKVLYAALAAFALLLLSGYATLRSPIVIRAESSRLGFVTTTYYVPEFRSPIVFDLACGQAWCRWAPLPQSSSRRDTRVPTPSSPVSRPDAQPRIAVFFSPHGGAGDVVVRALRGARRQVLVAIYDLTDDRIAGALVDAAHRHVDTRVIMGARGGQYGVLASALGPRLVLRSGVGNPHAIMHDKFAVIDGSVVLTGSFNWTRLAECCNHENLLVIEDRALARAFAQEFSRIWNAPARGEPVFPPAGQGGPSAPAPPKIVSVEDAPSTPAGAQPTPADPPPSIPHTP